MTIIIDRLEEAFNTRVGGTAMLPASDVLSASIEIQRIQTELVEAHRQLANEKARDIHSCGDNCTRPGCVNRRLRDAIEKAAEQIRRCDYTPARSTLLGVLK